MTNNNENTVLGLDISTSIIGVAITNNMKLVFHDFIDVKKVLIKQRNCYFKTLEYIESYLSNLKSKFDITTVHIEEPIKRVSSGKSSINSITKLYSYNYPITWICYKIFQFPPVYIKATSARRIHEIKKSNELTLKDVNFLKGTKEIKILALQKVLEYFPDFRNKFTFTTRGNIQPHWLDIADAIIVSLAV
jgi:hypothetical protein